jgi:VanZ family protein
MSWRLALLVGWLLFQLLLTHLPATTLSAERWFPHEDKVGHFVLYAVLAFLTFRVNGLIRSPRAGLAFAWLAMLGIVDELTQVWVRRDTDVLDWCADLAGVVLVYGIASFRELQAKKSTTQEIDSSSISSPSEKGR